MNEGFMPTMLQIPTMLSHRTHSPASPPTSERSPAFIYTCMASHVDCGHTFSPRGGAAGWKVTTVFLCREKPDRNWWPQTSGQTPPSRQPGTSAGQWVQFWQHPGEYWGIYQFRTAATSFLLHFRRTQFCSHSQNPHLMVLRVGFVKPVLVISL